MATNGQDNDMPAIAHGKGMRILFLAPFAAGGPKGTTRWRVLPLARALAAQGHTVRVLIPPYDCPRQSGLSWLDQGVQVDNLDLPPLSRLAEPVGHGPEAGSGGCDLAA